MTKEILNVINSAADEAIKATATPKPARKKATPKPKAATKAKPKLEPKPAPTKEPKPAPITLEGFILKDITQSGVEAITSDAKEVAKASEAINNKEADLFSAYMTLGKFASEVSPHFTSTKVYGQYLAKVAPASQALDPALRSNCKWLYEALNVKDHEASDLLKALGVNRIEDFKSQNPTVIKREYKVALKKASIASEAGCSVDDEEALAAAEKAAKDEAKAELEATANDLRQLISDKLSKFKTKADIADIGASIIAEFYKSKSAGVKMLETELDVTAE